MNIILINVSFENGTCEVSGINLITGDYNSTVCKFTFDKEDGTKVFKMKNPNDQTVFEREIVDNEVVLTGYDEHDEPASIFNSEGDYAFEVNLYDNDGRLTSSKGVISVEEELVKDGDEEIEVYKPLFDQLMQQLDNAISEVDNLDIDAEKVDNTATVSITNRNGETKTVEIYDGEKGEDGEPGITPNIQVGNTTTLPAGSNATVSQRGTTENPIFDFGIPKGADGEGKVTSVNGQIGDVVINIPDTSGLGASIELSINSSTYVMTLNLKNENGTVLSTGTVDLPLESVVVNGSYDSVNKKIVLTLQSGSTIDVPVGDLISGLQSEITSSNKLSSDLVDDTNQANKFVTTSEKTAWNAKYDKPSTGIPSSDLSSSVQTSLGKADTAIQDVSDKQDTLVSGTNIKTINNQIILGSGNIDIEVDDDILILQYNDNSDKAKAKAGKAINSHYGKSILGCIANTRPVLLKCTVSQQQSFYKFIFQGILDYANRGFYVFTINGTWTDNVFTCTSISYDMEYNPGIFAYALSTKNTEAYTPTQSTHPATKGYVDGLVGDISTILETLVTVEESE